MLAQHELRKYTGGEAVWVGKYKNLTNLPHWHYDCELIYADFGGAAVTIDNRVYRLRAGQAVFINSKTVHYIKAENGSVLSFFLFDSDIIKPVLLSARLKEPVLRGEYGIPGIFSDLADSLNKKPPFYYLSVNNKMQGLMLEIFKGEETLQAAPGEKPVTKQYRKLLEEIDDKYAYYTFSDAADFMGMSESYFSRLFRKFSDITFSEYLNYVKTVKAVDLIKEGSSLSMTAIAIKCGFGTIRNFNRVFKRITGFNPKKLPPDYVLFNTRRFKDAKELFDPTLGPSELIGKRPV